MSPLLTFYCQKTSDKHIQLCGKVGNSVYVPKKRKQLLAVPTTQVREMYTVALSY